MKRNKKTIENFGNEWSKFSQENLTNNELEHLFKRYFDIFPLHKISQNSVGFDLGCGSGRFSKFFIDKVKQLHCIEPSEAINVAKKNLSNFNNIIFHQVSIEDMIMPSKSMDFGICLGVLHHMHNIDIGLKKTSEMLKKDSPFLLYLYYAFDNKPIWYGLIWKFSNILRIIISRLPKRIKFFVSDLLALFVYFPLARISLILSKYFRINVNNFPLNAYRNLSFYTMRTDSLDRFGTLIENRYTKKQITDMLEKNGFKNVTFSNQIPYWCAVCYKK
jgi:ubiquinone/menaquinone biosynthesis C-methylase UbiE